MKYSAISILENDHNMSFNPKLKSGDIKTNQEIMDIFLCGNSGGMRKSNRTKTLTIISDHTKSLYDDKWFNNEFHYTGMGQIGDQKLSFGQNKNLYNSNKNNIDIFLFEVFNRNEYTFQGKVKLTSIPYQEQQVDSNGDLRSVWMFPISLIDNKPIKMDQKIQSKINDKRIKVFQNWDSKKIKDIAEARKAIPTQKTYITSSRYERDPIIIIYALKRANGTCQLCEKPAPFCKPNGQPYLQVHHVEYLSKGGLDIPENVVALCPNCHAKMHTLELKKDIQKLKALARIKLLANN